MDRTKLIQQLKMDKAESARQAQTLGDFSAGQQIRQQVRQRSMQPAQQMAAQQVVQTGQRAAQASQAAQKAAAQQAQVQEQQRKLEMSKKLTEMQSQLSEQSRQNAQRLFGLDQRLKNQLLDRQLQFQTDEIGRTLFNTRQLADFKLATAKSQEELKNYEQQVQQEMQKRMTILKFAQAKLQQELEQTMKLEQTKKNNALKIRLEKALVNTKKKIAEQRAKAANEAGKMSAMSQIFGAGVAGAAVAFGGPAGAAAAPGIMSASSGLFNYVGTKYF